MSVSPPSVARRPEALMPWRILLAEDNPGDADVLCEAIEMTCAGATLTVVESLREAMEQAGTGRYELLMLDLGLPDSVGLDTLRAAQRQAPDLPVVVMTGLDDESTAQQALREGAQDYLVKGEWPRQGGRQSLVRSLQYAIGRHRTLAALREATRVRSEFLAAASHELRTPITIIRDYAWLLSDGTVGPLEPAQAEFVEAILRNAARLTVLVNDLLDATRMDLGSLPLKLEVTQPAELLRQCHDDFAVECGLKSLHFQLHLGADLLPITCDRNRLTQVILNLLSNAHRFTPEGGTISLQARNREDDVEIVVQDTGIGISPEDQGRIFEAFVQVDRRSGPGPQGAGLGLHIVKRIVEMHGGTVGVLSQIGHGSAFVVTLPGAHAGRLDDLRAKALLRSAVSRESARQPNQSVA